MLASVHPSVFPSVEWKWSFAPPVLGGKGEHKALRVGSVQRCLSAAGQHPGKRKRAARSKEFPGVVFPLPALGGSLKPPVSKSLQWVFKPGISRWFFRSIHAAGIQSILRAVGFTACSGEVQKCIWELLPGCLIWSFQLLRSTGHLFAIGDTGLPKACITLKNNRTGLIPVLLHTVGWCSCWGTEGSINEP